MPRPLLLVITGPTASGKSALAIQLARILGCHIVSADSRQIYRGIPIVTAAPSPDELAAAPHHFIACRNLTEPYSAAAYADDVEKLLPQLWANNPIAIMCGGSMMYIDAVINGLDTLPPIPESTRLRVLEHYNTHGTEGLRSWLRQLDPEYYDRVDLNNHARLIHAIEVSLEAGMPYSSLLNRPKKERPYDVLMVAPQWPRHALFERINARVNAMVGGGLEEEARSVFHLRHLNSLNTVGLKEMFAYFDGMLSRETAISRIAKNTRVYAKKQLTWMRKYTNLHWLDSNGDMVAATLQLLQAHRQ